MSDLSLPEKSANFAVSRTGIEFFGELSYEEWHAIGDQLIPMAKSIGFVIGDWLNYGSSRYGDKYTDALAMIQLELSTIQKYSYVANSVQTCVRTQDLPWEHHLIVAKIKEPEEQRRWLEIAVSDRMSTRRFRKSINAGRPLSPEEAKEDPTDRGWVTYLALINRLRRWWKQETDKLPLDKWDTERRRVLKHDFQVLADIHDQL